MGYFKTDFTVQDFQGCSFSDRIHTILHSLLLHNNICTQVNVENIKEFEDMIIQNEWLPKDFDFYEFYIEKDSTIFIP